jgi:hypothetical protein
VHPFIAGYFGKERRTREGDVVNPVAGTDFLSYCAPLFGVKGGVQYQINPRFMLAPAVGVAINTDEADQSSIFADLELNYTFAGGSYIGTGVGIWDFNHSDTVTGNLLIHFGVPITRDAANDPRLLFAVEGRLFFDEFGDPANNYQFWGGVRYVFK